MRTVPHQITLVAFIQHEDGSWSVADLIETSFRHASKFWRRLVSSGDLVAIRVCYPGTWKGRTVLLPQKRKLEGQFDA